MLAKDAKILPSPDDLKRAKEIIDKLHRISVQELAMEIALARLRRVCDELNKG